MKKIFVLSIMMVLALNILGQDKKTAKEIDGTWLYTADMAPYEYQSGKVIFYEENGEYKAKIDIDGFVVPIQDLKIEKSMVSCSATIEYELIKIKLTLKDGKLSGNAETSEGSIPVVLEKEN